MTTIHNSTRLWLLDISLHRNIFTSSLPLQLLILINLSLHSLSFLLWSFSCHWSGTFFLYLFPPWLLYSIFSSLPSYIHRAPLPKSSLGLLPCLCFHLTHFTAKPFCVPLLLCAYNLFPPTLSKLLSQASTMSSLSIKWVAFLPFPISFLLLQLRIQSIIQIFSTPPGQLAWGHHTGWWLPSQFPSQCLVGLVDTCLSCSLWIASMGQPVRLCLHRCTWRTLIPSLACP